MLKDFESKIIGKFLFHFFNFIGKKGFSFPKIVEFSTVFGSSHRAATAASKNCAVKNTTIGWQPEINSSSYCSAARASSRELPSEKLSLAHGALTNNSELVELSQIDRLNKEPF